MRSERPRIFPCANSHAKSKSLLPSFQTFELGRRNPSEEVSAKIAGYFKIPVEEIRKLDTRVAFADFKRLVEKDPKLGFAFRTAVEEVSQGRATTEDLTKKLS